MATIEEKAKRYDEAIEIAKEINNEHRAQPFNVMTRVFPELKELEDEEIRKELVAFVESRLAGFPKCDRFIAWLEKQSKSTQETEPFEAEHGKYYYCIKDYFCGGRKQASKGDVVQALRGLPIMGLKDASEYFLPVNFIKCNSAWSEGDEENLNWFEKFFRAESVIAEGKDIPQDKYLWFKNLKDRVQTKQKWGEEDERMYSKTIFALAGFMGNEDVIDWLKSLRPQKQWKPSEEQIKVCKEVYVDILSAKGFDLGTINSELNRLEEELKKLKE